METKYLIFIFILLLLNSFIVSAIEDSIKLESHNEKAGIKPDSSFYFFDLLSEKIQSLFMNDEEKMDFYLELADERLAEVNSINNNMGATSKVIKENLLAVNNSILVYQKFKNDTEVRKLNYNFSNFYLNLKNYNKRSNFIYSLISPSTALDIDEIIGNALPLEVELISFIRQVQPGPPNVSTAMYELCFNFTQKGKNDINFGYKFLVDDEEYKLSYKDVAKYHECDTESYGIFCVGCNLEKISGNHTMTFSIFSDTGKIFNVTRFGELTFDTKESGPVVEEVKEEKKLKLEVQSFKGFYIYGPAGFRGYLLCFKADDWAFSDEEEVSFSVEADDNDYEHTGEGIGIVHADSGIDRERSKCTDKSFGIPCYPSCDLQNLSGKKDVTLRAVTKTGKRYIDSITVEFDMIKEVKTW